LSPELVTIILNDLSEFPLLRDNMGYLAIKLVMKKNSEVRYAIIEIQNDESICCFAFRG
jgi:polyphosphate kinase